MQAQRKKQRALQLRSPQRQHGSRTLHPTSHFPQTDADDRCRLENRRLGWDPLRHVLLACVVIGLDAAAAAPWVAGPSLGVPRAGFSATLLDDEGVLICGGYTPGVSSGCERFDPKTNSFSGAGDMSVARHSHRAVKLKNGQVLLCGGMNGLGASVGSCDRYEPRDGGWAPTGSLSAPRNLHTMTLLADGTVLVAGGRNDSAILATSELYDPTTGSWIAVGDLPSPRLEPRATLLSDGRVLLMGGENPMSTAQSTCAAYDSSARAWTTTAPMSHSRRSFGATLLPDGKLLVIGGTDENGAPVTEGERFDPLTNLWSPTGPSVDHFGGTLSLLADGRAVVAGGYTQGMVEGVTEIFDSQTGAWTRVGDLNTARYFAEAVATPNGNLLVIGGQDRTNTALSSVECFDAGFVRPDAGDGEADGGMRQPRRLAVGCGCGQGSSASMWMLALAIWPLARARRMRSPPCASSLQAARLIR
jgi:hypothetical protein